MINQSGVFFYGTDMLILSTKYGHEKLIQEGKSMYFSSLDSSYSLTTTLIEEDFTSYIITDSSTD